MGSVFPLFYVLLLVIPLALPSSSAELPSSSSITERFTITDDKTIVNVRSPRLLDLVIRDYTVRLFDEKKFQTGVVKGVTLPANLSGIKVDTARFRCGSLRRYGARIKEFYLRKGVIINPCVERVILIRQELGFNWSTLYNDNYKLQGYELVTPIIGLLAYNGGDDYKNISSPDPFELRIFADKDPIKVDFSNVSWINSNKIKGKMPYCANFEGHGKVTLKSMVSPHVCEAKKQGHIGLVIAVTSPSSTAQYPNRISKWKIILGSSVGAVLGAFLLGLLLIAMFAKAKKKSKLEEMVRRAYEEEALQVSMVGHVRAPTAPATRTVPIIEHDYRPPYY
ncbi:Interleukin-1 receptor-like 2 [Bienertia sinuspersici]